MDLLSDPSRDRLTVIQVTHDERFAERGDRTLQRFDGRIRPGD
jgi:ABC-type lipoprotein export system ATPase subunit